MVHARRLGDRVLEFGVSGSLWNDAMVTYDRETGSLWSHVTGECIEGELEGARLAMLPATVVGFREWVTLHPATLVLAKPAGAGDSSRYRRYAESDRQGIFGTSARRRELDPKAVVQGVAVGGAAAAIPHGALAPGVPVAFELAGRPLVALRAGAAVRVFVRRAAAHLLRLERASGAEPALRDRGTGTVWSARTGQGLRGPLAEHALEELPSTTAYWFAWINFYPRARIVR